MSERGVRKARGGCVGWARMYLKFYLNMDDQFVEPVYVEVTACWKITSAAVVVGTAVLYKHAFLCAIALKFESINC